jgi:ABC-type glycerol-3-phosphate transport system permease component
MCFATLFFLIPAIWVVLTALKTEREYNAYPIVLFPAVPQWDNFRLAVTIVPYMRYARNSLVLAGSTTLLNAITSSMGGFAFARHNVRERNLLFILVLSVMMLPNMVTLVPQFVLFSRLKLVGTYWPWILGGIAGSPLHIFLFRQFFAAIPRDLEDAADVDGASRLRIYWQIFMPISGPVIATSSILNFQWVWGEWLRPILYLKDRNTTLAARMASSYKDPAGNQLVTPLMAGICIYALPLIIVFFLAQRHIIQGVVTSGLKG